MSRLTDYRPRMVRWLSGLAVGGILTGFALLLVTGRYINDGPVLATVSSDHGVHEGDLFVFAGWLVAMIALVVLVRATGRAHARPTTEDLSRG